MNGVLYPTLDFFLTLGLAQEVVVHSADIQDRDGAKLLLERIKEEMTTRFPRLKKLRADGGYSGSLVDWVAETLGCELEIVGKPKDQKGFQVLPRRWVVERTFSWFGKYRRLSKDYEAIPQSGEAAIYGTMIHLMIRRLCPPKPTQSLSFPYLFLASLSCHREEGGKPTDAAIRG